MSGQGPESEAEYAGAMDVEVVDHAPPSTTVDLRVTHEVIRPLDPGEVVEAMRSHQELLRRILDPSDWQGAPDAKGSFVKKSGWRKIALAYNLALGRVSEEVERDDSGMPLRATFTAWAQAPNGRRVEATGHCAYAESRFSGPRGNISKLENDIRATAETRAKNRAISDLIGMGKVSAEEAEADGTNQPFGPIATPAQHGQAERAVAYVLGTTDGAAARAVLDTIRDKAGGDLPWLAVQAVGLLAAALRKASDTTSDIPSDVPPREAVDGEPDDTPIDSSPDARMQALMEAGCICSDPLDGPHDDDCPVHGPSAAPAP